MDEREQVSYQPELQDGEFRRVGPGVTAFQSQPTPLPAAPKSKRPVVILCVVLVALLGAGGAWWASRAPAQIHVAGTLTLGLLAYVDTSNPGTEFDGDACQGVEGYNDINGGIAVTIGGSTGQTLGIGQLGYGVVRNVDDSLGTAMGDCVFSFDVPVPSGQSVYTVTISHRGTQTFTPAEVAGGVALTLGN